MGSFHQGGGCLRGRLAGRAELDGGSVITMLQLSALNTAQLEVVRNHLSERPQLAWSRNHWRG